MATPDSNAAVVEELSATPVWLGAAFQKLRGRRAYRRPAEHEWSAVEVLAHVRAADAICAPRLIQVLLRDGVVLPVFDDRAWAALVFATYIPIAEQLGAFTVQRRELVAVLSALRAPEWMRIGQHEDRGAVRILDLARDMAHHEAAHRQQLEAVVAVAGTS